MILAKNKTTVIVLWMVVQLLLMIGRGYGALVNMVVTVNKAATNTLVCVHCTLALTDTQCSSHHNEVCFSIEYMKTCNES